MASSKKCKSKQKFMNNILDDAFHPNEPICQIITTDAQKKKEDAFTKLKPKPKTCLDYTISQTDAKLDAGPTKIHLQETVADYVPNLSQPPPKKKKFKKGKYFSGGPPCWKFLDEVWLEKNIKQQKIIYEEARKQTKLMKKEMKAYTLGEHRKAISLVGPVWFQELSPKQIATVDNLKNCIIKDLAEGTIINVQENIANLGLVLRPNRGHFTKALKHCCKCPVEFLLSLYQLINPARTKYSINDRLLLSAVVHLTMMDTLRELHIRIPSPPKPPKSQQKVPKKKKKIKYASPYLVPYSFKREPPKFTGIYYNKHVQRPQSHYFCYLEELRIRQKKAAAGPVSTLVLSKSESATKKTEDKTEVLDEEIEKELIAAQSLYEQLVDFRPVPVLLKPSKYIPCDNFRTRQLREKELEEEIAKIEEETEEELFDNTLCYYADEEDICCDAEREINDVILDGACFCASQNAERDKNSSCDPNDDETSKKSDSISTTLTCPPSEDKRCVSERAKEKCFYEDEICDCKPKLRGGADQNSQSVYNTKCFYVNQNVQNLCSYCKVMLESKPKKNNKIDCRQQTQDFMATPLCQCARCTEERKKKCTSYIISGMKKESHEVVPIIDGLLLEKPCDCAKTYQARIKAHEQEEEEAARRPCNCHKFAKKIMERPLCPCERCQEDRKNKGTKFIITGIKETENKQKIKIIEGVTTDRPCKCVKGYEDRVEKYEAYQKRKKLVSAIKEQEHKYIIGGVVNTAQGPVYIISGMRPPIDCACAKHAREEEAEEKRLAMMPQMPRGRIQYHIGGVKTTPQGNVYILNSALPSDECPCMDLYKEFTEQHATCLEMYDEYLALMKSEYNEFMSDMLPKSQASKLTLLSRNINDEDEASGTNSRDEASGKSKEDEKTESAEVEVSVRGSDKPQTLESVKEPCTGPRVCSHNYAYPVCCYCGLVQKHPCTECSCGIKNVECIDCTCGVEEVEEEEEVVEEEEPKLSRFFIFKKISCKPKWQRNVLKKALQSMADDGFPLAKLPNCHKLPHFKLWMQMRCGQYWTLPEKYKYLFKSKALWRHTDICAARKDPFPKLPLTLDEANELDWSKAAYCRRIANETLEAFYRRVKQIRINVGREFFPSTFTYEFPFNTWRDCYFAFNPTKEEEVLARFVWLKYDFKDFADMERYCSS